MHNSKYTEWLPLKSRYGAFSKSLRFRLRQKSNNRRLETRGNGGVIIHLKLLVPSAPARDDIASASPFRTDSSHTPVPRLRIQHRPFRGQACRWCSNRAALQIPCTRFAVVWPGDDVALGASMQRKMIRRDVCVEVSAARQSRSGMPWLRRRRRGQRLHRAQQAPLWSLDTSSTIAADACCWVSRAHVIFYFHDSLIDGLVGVFGLGEDGSTKRAGDG